MRSLDCLQPLLLAPRGPGPESPVISFAAYVRRCPFLLKFFFVPFFSTCAAHDVSECVAIAALVWWPTCEFATERKKVCGDL